MYNGMNLLLAYLAAEGSRYVFGVPGGSLAEFMRATHQSNEIEFIVSKQETGGAFMADGYARVSGRLGVCVATTGPGSTNMLTGVAAASFDRVPVLAISGCTARSDAGRGAFQETSTAVVDMAAIVRHVGAFGELVSDPRALPTALGRALRHCWAGGGGAAFVGIPTDVGAAPSNPEWAPRSAAQYRGGSRPFDESTVSRAVEILAKANSPCIFVGSGARSIARSNLLTGLAERLGAPVVTSQRGKGIFPEDHRLSLKNFGIASSLWADEWLTGPNVDVLLIIGSSLTEWATSAWSSKAFAGRTIIQIDIDPNNVARPILIEHAVIGHVEPALAAIHRKLDSVDIPLRDVVARCEKVAVFKRSHASAKDVKLESSEARPLKPQRVIRELESALPDDAIVFVDTGNTTFWLLHHWSMRGRQEFHFSGMASMGHGFAASIGGKFAAPGRPVIAVGGDGALLMNGCELHTAVQYDVPVVWIVFNDKKYGTIKHGLQQLIGMEIYSALDDFDPARFAESVGAASMRIDGPGELARALPRAIAMGRPVLLSVSVDPEEAPPFGSRIRDLKAQIQGDIVGGFGRRS